MNQKVHLYPILTWIEVPTLCPLTVTTQSRLNETETPSITKESGHSVQDHAYQERQGVCFIMDHVYIPEDVTILKELFTYLGYETKLIESEIGQTSTLVIQNNLKTDTKIDDKSAIVIVLNVAYGDMNCDINDYQQAFDCCDMLKDKPKILITHLYDGKPQKLNQPPDDMLHISSQMTDDDTGVALFIRSLDAVFREHHSTCDIYELLTKVLRDVEIPQHVTRRNMANIPATYPHHTVIFKTSLKSPLTIGTTRRDNIDDYTHSSHGSSSLVPGQNKLLERISKYALKTVFSVHMDLKSTAAFYRHHYRMDRKPRGLCVIVNMSHDRSGSLVDEVKMAQLFKELYFDVRIINNRTHQDIEKEIKALSSVISSLHQCAVVLIMGHGTTVNKVHYFADVTYTKKSSDYVLDVFKNQKHLIGKPKIFIIQTCFGERAMKGHFASTIKEIRFDPEEELQEAVQREEPFAVHKDSDTIQLNATLEDYMSYRMPIEGSYLIQAVDQILRKYSAEKDVTQLMTLIKNEVIHLGIKRAALQQAKVEDIQNLHLYLNPGYSVSEPVHLPDISTCKQVCVDGSIVWTASPRVACVADRCNTWIKLVNVETNKRSIYVPQDRGDVIKILSGVSVRGRDCTYDNKHIIIVKTLSGFTDILLICLSGNTWQKLPSLFTKVKSCTQEMLRVHVKSEGLSNENHADAVRAPELSECEPLTLCAVNNDAFAVLYGKRGSSECVIHVYSCDDIHNGSTRANSTRLRLRCKTPSIESNKFCIGIRDKMCYSNTKFYISCFSKSIVFQFDSQGNLEQMFGEAATMPDMKIPGSLYKPCGLFTNTGDSSEIITICCFDCIHTASIIENSDGTWQPKWVLDRQLFDKTHGMWYSNETVLTIIDRGLDYTSLSSAPNLEVSSPTGFTPNHIRRFDSQLVQTVWPTSEPDTVAVGSAESAHIFLVRSDGELLGTGSIDKHARIVSGMNLNRQKHLIVLHDDHKTYLSYVDLTEKDYSNPDFDGHRHQVKAYIPYMEEDCDGQPISLFLVDADHYGLLIGPETKTDFKYRAVLKIYNRITQTQHKRVILHDIEVGVHDRVCVDMNGLYILSSYTKNHLYTFDVDGTLLATIDTHVPNPCSVMVDEKNNLLVQCQNSLYKYTYNKGTESASSASDWRIMIDGLSWDVCYSGKNIYTVYENSLSVYQTEKKNPPLIKLVDKGSRLKGNHVHKYQKKNPPLIKLVDEGALLEGVPVHKYHYPPIWTPSGVKSLKYNTYIGMNTESTTCWPVHDNDRVIVGGTNKNRQATLNVVSTTGQFIPHVLSCGQSVMSGLLVKKWLHIICVTYDCSYKTNSNKIHLIKLDPTSTDSSKIHPLITLDVTNPVHVFRKSKQLYGVLCIDGYPYTNGRIRLLGLDQLILPTYTDSRTLQSTALWGRRTLLPLDLPSPHLCDTVAVTPRGQYCIASWLRSEILVYSVTGVYMYSVGEESDTSLPGVLDGPRSVQCTADNCLLVTGQNGDIQIYNMSSETGELTRSNKRMVKDFDGRSMVYYFKDDPGGWKIMRDRQRSKLIYYSALTSSHVWDIDTSDNRVYIYDIIH